VKQVDFALELIAEPLSSSDHIMACPVWKDLKKREKKLKKHVEWAHELIVELLS